MKINELGLNHIGHNTLLSEPKYTLIVDTPGELDWYKLGQHFATLGQQDPREFGQPESDMMIVAPNEEQLTRYMKELDRLGATYKLVGGTHTHPEIHSESAMGEEITDFNAQEPMASKVAVQGYGTMNLETLMKNISSTIKQLGELRNDPSSYRRLNYELYDSGVLQAKIKAVITALDQLQDIKRKGGKRSVNIQKEAEQQELPIDVNNIIKLIQKLESSRYIAPEDADKMRRAVESLTSARQTINPAALLQLLTIASK